MMSKVAFPSMNFDEEEEYVYYQGHGHVTGQVAQTYTTKIPPPFNGKTSWFAFEDAVLDWIDITELDAEKQGPALKNGLRDEAAVYKPLLIRDKLKDKENGVNYFLKEMRPRFVKGAQSIFLWRLFQFFYFRRGRGKNMLDWIGRFQVLTKRLKDSWMDMYEPFSKAGTAFQAYWTTVQADERAARVPTAERTTEDGAFEAFETEKKQEHMDNFPLSENLYALLFYCLADLDSRQRENFETIAETQNLEV